MLTCCSCQESGFNRNTLEMHIATQHIFYSAYECEHCKTAQFPSEFALRQHYQQDHRQKVFYIRYRVTPELEKKREVLETLIRKSLGSSNSGEEDGNNGGDNTNMNDTTPSFIPNIDQLEATQLLNCMQAGPNGYTLLKYDVDDPESGENAVGDAILNRNGEMVNYENPISSYSTTTTSVAGKTVTAIQSLLSINGNVMQSDHQQHQQQHQNQQLHLQAHAPQFFQIQPPSSSFNGSEASMPDGEMSAEQGSELLKLFAKPDRAIKEESPGSSSKRPSRVSSQIACIDCGGKVSNYMNSLVLHVSTHHCDLPVYECLACNKQWFSLSARFKDHMRTRHDGNLSLLKDNRHSIMPMLKEKAVKLFPDHRFS